MGEDLTPKEPKTTSQYPDFVICSQVI